MNSLHIGISCHEPTLGASGSQRWACNDEQVNPPITSWIFRPFGSGTGSIVGAWCRTGCLQDEQDLSKTGRREFCSLRMEKSEPECAEPDIPYRFLMSLQVAVGMAGTTTGTTVE